MAQLIEHTVQAGVAYIPVPNEAWGHGMTMTLRGETLIAAGCTEHPMRLRSTLAHELGHIRLGTVTRDVGTTGWAENSDAEIQANVFARHLLVPLAAVREACYGLTPSEVILSDLVQSHMASPAIVAIQMSNANLIDAPTCERWKKLRTPGLASRYGWRAAYTTMVTQSQTPKSPQRLMSRAIEAYRWGLVPPAMIARLAGDTSARDAETRLRADGIEPRDMGSLEAEAPVENGLDLSPEELAMMMGDDH